MADVTDHATDERTQRAAIAPLPRWKKILLGCAAALVAIGLALIPFESGEREDLATAQSAGRGETLQGPGNQLVPTGTGQQDRPGTDEGAGTASTDPDMSPAFLKLGFSFLAAFAVGLAFRSFVKIALIVVGLQLLMLFLLSYVDWVTVNWETMSTAFERFSENVRREAESFQTFVTGSLPQAGLAALGLVAGFKR